jgi:hypothetical protein
VGAAIDCSALERALVVGGLILAADETGNPVQIRDGPAAVTEHEPRSILVWPLPVSK